MCWLCRENEVGFFDSNLRYQVGETDSQYWAFGPGPWTQGIKSSLNHVKDCDLGSSDCKTTEEKNY